MCVSFGTLSPRSMNPTWSAETPASSASRSWVQPFTFRRSRTAAPNATASGARFFLGGIILHFATANIKLHLPGQVNDTLGGLHLEGRHQTWAACPRRLP